MAMPRCLRHALPLALAGALLAGCGTGVLDVFNAEDEGDDDALPGNRLSVLELSQDLEPDPQVVDLQVVVPEPVAYAEWPQPGLKPDHAPLHLELEFPLRRLWSASVGAGSSANRRLLNPPVKADGRLFAMDARGRVTALDAGTGAELWRVLVAFPEEDSNPLGGGLAYWEGRLFATTGFGEVLALDPGNGGLLWRAVVNGPVRAAPTVFGGRVYVVTVDNQLEAFDADTGEPLWTHTGILEPAGLLGGASPAAGAGVVLAAYSSGEIFALRAETGRPLWSDSLAAVRRVGALASLADIRGMPVLYQDAVYTISHSGRMAAIDLRTGARIWEQDIGGTQMPWVAGDFVFVMSNNNEVVALTRDSGRVRWVSPLPRFADPETRTSPIVWFGPVLAGGDLIAVSSQGVMTFMSPSSGALLDTFRLSEDTEMPPIVAGRRLYILDEDGVLSAFGPA